MAKKETTVQKITRLTSDEFPFMDGVNIEQVVRFVLAKRSAIESARRKKNDPGNDARDIVYTAGLLKPLSSEDLKVIQKLKSREIFERLRNKTCPFSILNKETKERLLHLPISWIREGAEFKI